MRYSILLFIVVILMGGSPVSTLAVEIAPRISDREIIEKLATLEAGQAALRSEMKSGQAAIRSEMKSGQAAIDKRISDLRSEMKAGQEALGNRIDDMFSTMLALFTAMVTLIIALFAYIAWDRRTMLKPVVERLDSLENDVVRDLELRHTGGSLLSRQLKALRKYAKRNPEFAEIMRSLSLL